MTTRKNWPANLLVIGGIAIAILVLVWFFRYQGGGSINFNGQFSPNILYLTQPVFSFSGQIEKVSADSIQVSSLVYEQTAPPAPGKTGQLNNQSRKLTYAIKINKQTQISQFSQAIPYLFKNNGAAALQAFGQVKASDLKSGQSVNVTTDQDLRTLLNSVFVAKTITVNPPTIAVSGQIKSINGNTIVVTGIPNTPTFTAGNASSTPKEYAITVTNDTEIDQLGSPSDAGKTGVRGAKISLSDLKENSMVNVYTDQDLGAGQSSKALLITVQAKNLLSIPTQTLTATGSAVFVRNASASASPSR